MLRQRSLREVLCNVNPGSAAVVDVVQVTDLFCGAGGFSCGATMAGCNVVFACDSDKMALETHTLNHPFTKHVCGTLPHIRVPAPATGVHTHLHGSPPCQMFSTIRGEAISTRMEHPEGAQAASLVEWYLQFALLSSFTTWTMEQVPSPVVLRIAERMKRDHACQFAYEIIDMACFGVPQHRKRLIAGSPSIIDRIRRLRLLNRIKSVADVIRKPRGTHIRNGKCWVAWSVETGYCKAGVYQNMRSITKPAYTVVTNGDLRWVTPRSGSCTWKKLTVREIATLQTFPANYSLPVRSTLARMQIGNAVPPLFAKALMDAAPFCAACPMSPSLRLFPAAPDR